MEETFANTAPHAPERGWPAAEESPKTLTVYKASAGSGKTFTLALEYIKLLIGNPYAYERILAVTFTNKATEEMKMRILSTLYGLWKRLPSADSYMQAITADLQTNEELVSRNAEKALHLLLNNYHFFRVQTIDTFFQTVLRNLARELQLNANLRVGLDTQQVVDEAVDGIIDSLADNKALRRMVKGYMEERLAEEKAWNVIGHIKKFGQTIFQEAYKKNRSKMEAILADDDFFDRYKKTMRDIMRDTAERYTAKGKEILEEIEGMGLAVSDFSYGASGAMGYFTKLSSGQFCIDEDKLLGTRVRKAMEDPSAWVNKTSKKRDAIISLAEECLIPAMLAVERTRPADARLYRSAKVTLGHINDVRLLHRIEREARTLNEAAQRFMLSDTQSLLHELIEDSDSPFIYEKIGARLDHVMIDEFQDTSTIQWANFKPLLKECMSRGQGSLIVGDVKQSIYRFRAGDWRLLNDIDKEFRAQELEFRPKLTNWRSLRNIVGFNNHFFTAIAGIEAEGIARLSEDDAESLRKAYADVRQDVPARHSSSEGVVYIEMLPREELADMKERTLQNILDLVALGARQKDIAILVRWKKDIPGIAQYIESNSDIRIVSTEAFRLDASFSVQLIITAMRMLDNPDDAIAQAILREHKNEVYEMIKERYEELTTMTLHNLAEELVQMFGFDKQNREGAYISALFDNIHSFTKDMAPMLGDFLTAWEEEIAQKTIETTDIDGVRILTIHKSKGLEFDHVIVPYCNWKGDPPQANTIWVTPKAEPFSQLPMVPLDYRSINSLKGTIYEADGVEEYIQNIVDNLNLLYVAMTRASRSLFVIGERNTKAFTRSKAMCEAIMQLPEEIDGTEVHIEGLEDEALPLTVTYGRLQIKTASSGLTGEETSENNPFNTTPVTIETPFHSSNNAAITFRQSNDSRRFKDDTFDQSDRQRYIKMGTVMHQLFATIRTLDDLEPALQRMEFDGTLYDDDLTREELQQALRSRFENEQVRDWFSGRWTTYNECNIITPDGEQRPDRVMTDGKQTIVVDFKFGKPHEGYLQQVRRYMALLEDMAMPDVRGYIWYVSLNRIVEC